MPNFVADKELCNVPTDWMNQPFAVGDTVAHIRTMKQCIGVITEIKNRWDWSERKNRWAFTGLVFIQDRDMMSKCRNLDCLAVIKRVDGSYVY